MIAAVALSQALVHCAPRVGSRTMAAIVAVESGGDPLAMHDNADGRSYHPKTVDDATALAGALVARGHAVDLGLAQIDSANLSALGLSVRDAFDPCTNLHAAARILTGDYVIAVSRFGAGAPALVRALGAYNTGSFERGDGYAASVFAAARARFAALATNVRAAVRPHVPVRSIRRRVARSTHAPNDAPVLVYAATVPVR